MYGINGVILNGRVCVRYLASPMMQRNEMNGFVLCSVALNLRRFEMLIKATGGGCVSVCFCRVTDVMRLFR